MHEFSVMESVVAGVLEQTRERGDLLSIEAVTLEIGELTFLGHEQLRFGFQVLTEKEPLLKGARLDIVKKKARVQCPACGYKGGMDYVEEEAYHLALPIFSCPTCGDVVEIVEGKECMITNIRVVVDDGEEQGERGREDAGEGTVEHGGRRGRGDAHVHEEVT
ncbi:MAG: hydrogenase maturation nickel metallochaperone HypA [Thermoplasmata archaeon]|nr:hydrogenase maturation nickel metallochaperone HypA [Thermoplasmata archaeon]